MSWQCQGILNQLKCANPVFIASCCRYLINYHVNVTGAVALPYPNALPTGHQQTVNMYPSMPTTAYPVQAPPPMQAIPHMGYMNPSFVQPGSSVQIGLGGITVGIQPPAPQIACQVWHPGSGSASFPFNFMQQQSQPGSASFPFPLVQQPSQPIQQIPQQQLIMDGSSSDSSEETDESTVNDDNTAESSEEEDDGQYV